MAGWVGRRRSPHLQCRDRAAICRESDAARWRVASTAGLGDANLRPGKRPTGLVGQHRSAIPQRAGGLAFGQRRQRCHPQPSLQWSGERHDDQQMQVDFPEHDE
jgi:hypothetical protein